MNHPAVKREPSAVGATSFGVPASSFGSVAEDDDNYEDAGDLDFTSAHRSAFLIRLPKFLYDSWTAGNDEESSELRLGRVRVEGDASKPLRVRLNEGHESAGTDISR